MSFETAQKFRDARDAIIEFALSQSYDLKLYSRRKRIQTVCKETCIFKVYAS